MTSEDIQERMRYLLIKTGISPARILRRDNPDTTITIRRGNHRTQKKETRSDALSWST